MAYNIADLFEHAVDAVPDRVGFVIDDEEHTYAELEAQANRAAHHFLDQGVEPGDHIGIYGANSRQWVVAMLAAFKVRAVPVNVNYRYVEDELLYLLDNADLVILVFDAVLAPRVAAVADRAPKLRHLLHVAEPEGSAEATGAAEEDPAVAKAIIAMGSVDFDDAIADASPERDFGERSSDDHYVLYTGGTTGMPKGVVWRHEDVFMALGGGIDAYTNEPVAHEHQLADKAKATEAPLVSLCLPPLMHGAAQWSLMRFLFEGCRSVLVRKFDAHETWRQIERHKVNNMMMTGDAMARPLIEALEELDAAGEDLDLSSLFVAASSAAIWSPAVKDRFYERFPDIMVVDAIGSTETGSNGLLVAEKGNTSMQGGPTVKPARDAVVVDEDLNELPPGSPTLGRLARAGNTPIGYYKDEEKTRATFVTAANGKRYVLAGDMARHEADGSITLLGRGSGCINTGGEKVFPEEVEAALKAHPAVFDAIVVGVPDERWGQKVAAVVQPRLGAAPTLDDLDSHCRSRLAGYKIPRQLTLVEGVQRSPSGKPDYPWAQRVAVGAASEPTTTTFG
jgi:acyl-CoA synthetase (AMP-forming)/AMP-acid ligase II